MQNNIKARADKLATTPAAQGTFNVLKTVYRLAEILVPVAMAAYLIMKFDDIVILTIAGGLIVFAVVKLVTMAWQAVTLQPRKRK